MILLLIKKSNNWKEVVLALKVDKDVEVVREIVMRLSCYLEDLDYRLVAT